jgi:hypothetical protein
MKKTLMVLFCLSLGSAAFALPLSLRSGLSYGKFYDPGNSGGKVYQYETGVRTGRHLLLCASVLLEYYKYDELPSYFGIPEYRTVCEEKQQYSYGGSISLGIGNRFGPHLVYRFKKVRTYHKIVTTYFDNYDPGSYWTNADFKQEPAYDIVIGFHGKIPRTKLFMIGEWTAWSRIWNVERNMVTLGLGYEIGLGNIR